MSDARTPSDPADTSWVSHLLSQLPDPEMPAAVSAQVLSAIETELSDNGVGSGAVPRVPRRRKSWNPVAWTPRWVAVSVGAAAALIVLGTGIPLALHHDRSASRAASTLSDQLPTSAPNQPLAGSAIAPEAAALKLDPTNLSAEVRQVLNGSGSGASGSTETSQGAGTSGSGSIGAAPPQSAASNQLSQGCLNALARNEPTKRLVVQPVTWLSAPAFLVVFADGANANGVIAIVVDPMCASDDLHLLYQARFSL